MTEDEARKILGVTENTTWEDVLQVCLSSCLFHSWSRKFFHNTPIPRDNIHNLILFPCLFSEVR